HPDIEISKFTADLILEKYTLSKIHSKFHKLETEVDRLSELAPRFIFEYKLAIIMDKRKQKLMEMKTAAEARNDKMMQQIMREIEAIDNFKNKLSKELDRVLNLL
ncbi:MAG TPA: DNA primase, partial [Paludibacteraceae bacterium]|nr:DNA primase [Paludibacteraceae bacterium]